MPTRYKENKWRADKMIDGLRRTKVFNTKAEALKWESQQTKELWTPEPLGVTVLEWINRYLDHAEQRFIKATYKEKILAFKDLVKFIPESGLVEDITPQQASRVLSEVDRSRSGNAANKNRKNYIAAWTWGQKFLDLPASNPFKVVEKFRFDRRPLHVPPKEDMQRLLDTSTGETRAFLLFLLHTAARRGEALRLKWSDINFENDSLQLGTRKRRGGGMEYDQIPLTEELKNTLQDLKASARGEWVFCDENGEPYKHRIHLMKHACKRAKVTLFGFHAIRHLAASMLADANIPIPIIQKILRHKSSAMTAHYLHTIGAGDATRKALSEAMERMKR